MARHRTTIPHVPFEWLAQIERIVDRFGDCTLPCEEWTHAAHLTVGLWYAHQLPPTEALDRIRAGIKRYNVACGVADTPTDGYHETITRFYMWLIGSYLAGVTDRADWVAVTNGLVEHATVHAPNRYYSRERLMSVAARAAWLPPDLLPLD
ncbi:MAG: hypothetical protein WD845_00040 [Pirellulales bacterium]